MAVSTYRACGQRIRRLSRWRLVTFGFLAEARVNLLGRQVCPRPDRKVGRRGSGGDGRRLPLLLCTGTEARPLVGVPAYNVPGDRCFIPKTLSQPVASLSNGGGNGGPEQHAKRRSAARRSISRVRPDCGHRGPGSRSDKGHALSDGDALGDLRSGGLEGLRPRTTGSLSVPRSRPVPRAARQ